MYFDKITNPLEDNKSIPWLATISLIVLFDNLLEQSNPCTRVEMLKQANVCHILLCVLQGKGQNGQFV